MLPSWPVHPTEALSWPGIVSSVYGLTGMSHGLLYPGLPLCPGLLSPRVEKDLCPLSQQLVHCGWGQQGPAVSRQPWEPTTLAFP